MTSILSLRTALRRGTAEHYDDPRLYDHEYKRRRADVRFYKDYCREYYREHFEDHARNATGPILELGCGTGRVTTPLRKQGHAVVGLDLSQAMLGRCAERFGWAGRRLRGPGLLVRGDMRHLPLRGPFGLVLCPFNAFMHLYRQQDITACLSEVHRVLDPNQGRFVFDVQNPDLRWLLRDPRKRWARTRFKHPVTVRTMVYSTNHTYDAKRQIAHVKLYYDCPDDPSASRTVSLAHRQFFPQELRLLLNVHGFTLESEFGDFDGRPFEADSETQLLVCRPNGNVKIPTPDSCPP